MLRFALVRMSRASGNQSSFQSLAFISLEACTDHRYHLIFLFIALPDLASMFFMERPLKPRTLPIDHESYFTINAKPVVILHFRNQIRS
jgi:hypothetical protein